MSTTAVLALVAYLVSYLLCSVGAIAVIELIDRRRANRKSAAFHAFVEKHGRAPGTIDVSYIDFPERMT